VRIWFHTKRPCQIPNGDQVSNQFLELSIHSPGRVQKQQSSLKLDVTKVDALKEARKQKHLSNLEKDNFILVEQEKESSSSSSSEGILSTYINICILRTVWI
jgi:hypothetical protein